MAMDKESRQAWEQRAGALEAAARAELEAAARACQAHAEGLTEAAKAEVRA